MNSEPHSAAMLRRSLQDARAELATTPEAQAAFDHMVIVCHSMGGLVSKTLLQDPGDRLIRKATGGRSWEEIAPKCTPEERKMIEELALYKSLPFGRRMIFLAVPHRGARMAQYFQVRLIARLIKLPSGIVKDVRHMMENVRKNSAAGKLDAGIKTGLDELSPKAPSIQAVNEIPLRPDVPCHSIIGNEKMATPGGSDGVVEYSSSHLDQVRSELVVQSWHSVQTHPVAIYEVRRILLEHLKEEKICETDSPDKHRHVGKTAEH